PVGVPNDHRDVLENEVRPVPAEPDDLLSDLGGPAHVVVPDGPHATGRLHWFAPMSTEPLPPWGPGRLLSSAFPRPSPVIGPASAARLRPVSCAPPLRPPDRRSPPGRPDRASILHTGRPARP